MTQLRCKAKVDLHDSMEKWTMKDSETLFIFVPPYIVADLGVARDQQKHTLVATKGDSARRVLHKGLEERDVVALHPPQRSPALYEIPDQIAPLEAPELPEVFWP
ncbi:hypothetical protein HG530_003107 [Fusarium avenaceum]|nr:hypothetical protein HG530_003107 [Fusarium avenaceum]